MPEFGESWTEDAAALAKIVYLDYLEPQWSKSHALHALFVRKRHKPSPIAMAVRKELKRLKDDSDNS